MAANVIPSFEQISSSPDLLLNASTPINLQQAFLTDVSTQRGPLAEIQTPGGPTTGNTSFYPGGCDVGNGNSNCTSTCLDSSLLFSSIQTFHNCLMYPAAADLYAHGTLSANDVELADSMVIEKSERGSPLLNGMIDTIVACLHDYCPSSSDCADSLSKSYPASANNTIEAFFYQYGGSSYNVNRSMSLTAPDLFQFDLCTYSTPRSLLDPDIGGIGVSRESESTDAI